jgi:hypothetical protein
LTVVDKQVVIRAAIVNHRTQQRHADRFLEHLMASTLAVLHAEQQSP